MNSSWSGDRDCGGQLSLDETLAILQHQHRREVIEYCRRTEHRINNLDDLVEFIVNKRPSAVDRNQLAVKLYHIHLPRLAEEKVIEWDPRSRQFQYFRNDRLEQWLDQIDEPTSE